MNYNDIPFVIWAKDITGSQKIAKLLGRKSNTTLLSVDMQGLLQKGSINESFCSYFIHFDNNSAAISEVVPKLVKIQPFSCIILTSFNKVSDEDYRAFIRLGVRDIIEINQNTLMKDLQQNLLQILNQGWRIFRQIEIERKKTYQATIVTAHHEINQPLTVILNSLGLLNMELQKGVVGRAPAGRYVDFIMRSARRIQDILIQFKKIEHPRLVNYTANVPMIQIRDDNSDTPQNVQQAFGDKFILLYEKVEEYKNIESLILSQNGYNPILADSREETIRLARQYGNRLQAVIVGAEEKTNAIQDLIFELKVHTLKLPILLCTDEHDMKRCQSLLHEGAHGVLSRPFTIEQFSELLEVSQHVITF